MTAVALNPNGLVLDPPAAVAVAYCLISRFDGTSQSHPRPCVWDEWSRKDLARRSGNAARPHWYVSSPEVLVHGFGMVREPDTVEQTVARWTADAAFIAHARQDIPALLRVAEAVAMMPTPVGLNGCCTFCDAVMDVGQMTDDGHWPHEADCPLGMAHCALAELDALP